MGLHEGERQELWFRRGIVTERDESGSFYTVLFENKKPQAVTDEDTRFIGAQTIQLVCDSYRAEGSSGLFGIDQRLDFASLHICPDELAQVVRGAFIHVHYMRVAEMLTLVHSPPALGNRYYELCCIEPHLLPEDQVREYIETTANEKLLALQEQLRQLYEQDYQKALAQRQGHFNDLFLD